MKRFACLFLMMGMVLVLAACGGGSNPIRDRGTVLDYRSILDTELNLMFSLGDYRGDVEALLGRPFNESELDEVGRQTIVYDNGLLVMYMNNHIIYFFIVNIFYYPDSPENEEARFEALNIPLGMTLEQATEIFELSERDYYRWRYERWFDVYGNLTESLADLFVRHQIDWFTEDVIGYRIIISDVTAWNPS